MNVLLYYFLTEGIVINDDCIEPMKTLSRAKKMHGNYYSFVYNYNLAVDFINRKDVGCN